MKHYILFTLVTFLSLIGYEAQASIYSFESSGVPTEFTVSNGALSITNAKYKLGAKSLQWDWSAGSKLVMDNPSNLGKASTNRAGGITFWIYGTAASSEVLRFRFYNANGDEKCTYSINLNFAGWRSIWANFREDMGHDVSALSKVEIEAPASGAGVIYFDYLEFSEKISWEKMSSDQHTVKESTDNVDDFIGLRDAIPTTFTKEPTAKQLEDIATVEQRLEDWYLSDGGYANNKVYKWRRNNTNTYMNRAVNGISKFMLDNKVSVGADGKPLGTGIYPVHAATTIDGSKVIRFRELNEVYLTQLALDYQLRSNATSKTNALTLLDWMHDQGWANGSSLGSIRFEKLRSAGYFNGVFLMRKELGEERLKRELETLAWYSLMGSSHRPLGILGENTDNLRTLSIAKVAYAVMQPDAKAQLGNLEALAQYFETVSKESHGYLGLFKPDNSGFHHRSAYYSAYFPEALYTISLAYYLLHDTSFALSDETFDRIKNVLLTFRFVAAEYNVPASVSGRFPESKETALDLLPAFAYMAMSKETPDAELVAVLKRLWDTNNPQVEAHAKYVTTQITHKSTLGEISALLDATTKTQSVQAEERPVGQLYQPFAGLMTVRDKDYHYSTRGFSKYVWDYESGSNENLYGRYLSYGHIQFTDLNTGKSSFDIKNTNRDWARLPGTTAKYLPKAQLASDKHRNFSDQGFLGGVSLDNVALFSVQLHDPMFDKSFRANKSVFTIGTTLINMGSNITAEDAQNNIETTLFQNLFTAGESVNIDGQDVTASTPGIAKPSIVDNYGNTYKVLDGTVDFYLENGLSTAVINHGAAPTNAKYAYAILPNGDTQILDNIEILKQDDKAHYIHHKTLNIHAAALFASGEVEGVDKIKSVNAPALFVMKETKLSETDTQLDMVISDPDMRQKTAPTMEQLTAEDVAYPGDAFDFEMVLNGTYEVKGEGSKITATINDDKTTTTLKVTVKEGASYPVTLVSVEIEPEPTGITKITLSETLKKGLEFEIGDEDFSITQPMLFAIEPADYELTDLAYSSSDALVASITNGIIKIGKKAGTTKMVIASIINNDVRSEEFTINVVKPEPVKSVLTLVPDGKHRFKIQVRMNYGFKYDIYNTNGLKLESKQSQKDEASISLDGYPSGMYIVRVSVDNYNTKTYKLNR